ncbi:MAG: hypothetical protein JNJ59_12315 [Deltaproteobacteria bacterium]|nr:hypothetical protein [Deltaproteobacteria bacterium]
MTELQAGMNGIGSRAAGRASDPWGRVGAHGVLACLGWLALAACSGFDGGLEAVKNLPPPDTQVTDTSSDTAVTPDTSGELGISVTKPSARASVDGDWIVVEATLVGEPLARGLSVRFSVWPDGAEAAASSVVVAASSAVLRAPAGAATVRAELVEAGAPLTPPVSDEVAVTVTRLVPALALTAPANDAFFGVGEPVTYAFAVTDFTLLAAGAAPTGPRQGRVALAIDAGEPTVVANASGTLATLSAGAHTLVATLVDADGVAWPGAAPASVSFSVALPPVLRIVSPEAAQVVDGGRLLIALEVERFVLDGDLVPGHGTWRATLDGNLVASALTGTTASLSGLAAGEHRLEVELRSYDNEALNPPVVATVDFETRILPPGLDMVLPTSPRVAEGAVKVAVLPHYFVFTAGAIPGPLVAGQGGWQLLVDGVVARDRLTQTQAEVSLQPGTHQLTARLVDNAGTPLTPAVEAKRTVEVVAVETSVSILSPRPGEVVPKRFPVAVAFEDFTLSQTILAPNADPVPGRGHFHAFMRKQGGGAFVYQGFFLSETFELTADSAGTWEVLVALHYENHSQVVPPVEALVTVVVDDRPTIHVESPADGARIGRGPFAVAVSVDNFELIPVGEISDLRGHFHLFIDSVYQDFYTNPWAILDPATTKLTPLVKGTHTLEAFLHRSNHTPVTGAVGHIIDLEYDPTPRVRIVAPGPGDRVTGAPFDVQVEVDNLSVVDKAGAAAVPGEGHVHVFVDDVYQGFETTTRFPVTIASAGLHTIKVTLHENDHSAIAGTVPASVQVQVDTAPHVAIVTPEDGGFVYGAEPTFDLVGENLPTEGLVGLWLDGVLVEVGVPGLFTVPPLAEGPHEAVTMPLNAAGANLPNGVADTVRFEVVGVTPPRVSWVAPLPNATLLPGATVTIGVVGFSLDGALGLGPAVPGDGLWTLTTRARPDLVWGPYASATVPLPAMPSGAQTLIAELWHRDGSRVVPAAKAELPILVSAGPRLSVRAPRPENTWYGPAVGLEVVVTGATLGPTTGWVSVKVDGRQAALIAADTGTFGPVAAGQHVMEVELLKGDLTPYVPAVIAQSPLRVGGALPTVAITAPTPNTLVDGTVAVAFTVSGLTLDPVGLRGRPQVGRGAALVMVDGRVRAVATASPVTLTGLSPGPHRVEVVLVGLDLVPIRPATSAVVNIR